MDAMFFATKSVAEKWSSFGLIFWRKIIFKVDE